MKPIDIGCRLELMVDDYLVERFAGGAALRLHSPTRRQVALLTDRPWEGNMSGGYVAVFRDQDVYRMYYQGWACDLAAGAMRDTPLRVCYAESDDGVQWRRPVLGLWEFEGSTQNNIVWTGAGPAHKGAHGFAPFKDPNPGCAPQARYKALGAEAQDTAKGLYAMSSPDGIHWSLMREEPVMTEGAFDSQNLAFWDSVRAEYRAYVRDFREGRRDIRTATSNDFIHWTTPQWLEYPGAPPEQLYTNQVVPYYRAPHIFVGFPARYVERPWSAAIEALPELEHRRLRARAHPRYGAALTDGVFMSSRDGRTFRRWGEAFIRPGLRPVGNWAYGDNYQCWGIVQTRSDIEGAPEEMTFYVSEGHWRGEGVRICRYTMRADGFVSANAPLSGGEVVTKSLAFQGRELVVNFAASAAGSVRVEVQGPDGRPVEGFALADCVELLGDDLERRARWKAGADVGRLACTPVRLRFVLADADLYAFRFR